jgi:hypothetical protein
MRNTAAIFVSAVLLALALPGHTQGLNLPLGGGPAGIEGLKLVPTSGVTAKTEVVPAADQGKGALKVTFAKTGDERRLVALESRLTGKALLAKSLVLRYRLTLKSGNATPRLAVVLWDDAGGSWFKVAGQSAAEGNFADGCISLASPRRTAFSETPDAAILWDRVQRVWLGLVMDGPAEGTFEISQPRLTSEVYRPTQPIQVTGEGIGQWSVGQDPKVTSKLTTPNEGPQGQPCMKYEFTLPGGSHMYAIPSVGTIPADFEGYAAIRFAYKAIIPAGINGLLVCVGEADGTQYFADPPPPASPEWTDVTIPFSKFKFATWTKDENEQLDLSQVNRVFIGCHGVPAGTGGPGLIMATDIEFVP